MAYTVKRTALRWGIHDAALLYPGLSILLSTGQASHFITAAIGGRSLVIADVPISTNSHRYAAPAPCSPRWWPSSARAAGPPRRAGRAGRREFVSLPSTFYGKALEVLGAEVRGIYLGMYVAVLPLGYRLTYIQYVMHLSI